MVMNTRRFALPNVVTKLKFADMLAANFTRASERKIEGVAAVFTVTLDSGETFQVSVRKVSDATI